ncbi:MAG: O-antigen ligase family protein [Nitrospira sp.]|nr:O-antigen ligase family protein [Nitrospira sp.]
MQMEARRAAGWTTTALGFTIPMWVVADSILIGLLIVCWTASGEWREKLRRITANPVAVSVLLLFGWLLLGTLWGGGSLQERALSIKKYADLLLIPVLISMAIDVQERNRAILALAASLVVTLVLSLVLSMGTLLPTSGALNCDPSNPCVFKKHTTHNVLMAFGALLFAVLAWQSQDRRVRWGWSLVSLLAVGNVLLMVQGRTGYVVLAGLAILAFHSTLGWRGILAAIVVLTVSFSTAYQASSSFHERVNLAVSGVTQWNPKVAVVDDAVGWRLEYFYHTAEIIQDHPLIGVGTGGFVQAYRSRTEQAGLDVPPHPHNQYLFILVQVGIVGLGLLLWLFVQQWRWTALNRDAAYGLLAKGVVVTIAVGSFFNPFLVDHTEKLFYCLFSGLMYSRTDPQLDMRT